MTAPPVNPTQNSPQRISLLQEVYSCRECAIEGRSFVPEFEEARPGLFLKVSAAHRRHWHSEVAFRRVQPPANDESRCPQLCDGQLSEFLYALEQRRSSWAAIRGFLDDCARSRGALRFFTTELCKESSGSRLNRWGQ